MAATAAAKNRKVRQEALRDQLAAQKHHEYVFDIAKKLQEQSEDLSATAISALKASAEIRVKLLNKYLPDLKAIEHSSDPDSPIGMSISELDARIKQLTNELAKED